MQSDIGLEAHMRWSQEIQNEDEGIGEVDRNTGQVAARPAQSGGHRIGSFGIARILV